MKRKPSIFIVAGMPRTGTTFLYYFLQRHPQLFASFRKEINFFSVFYDRGRGWYESFFSSMKSHQLGMDISPLYFMDEKSIPRILDFDSDAKVILGIRDPLEWTISYYHQLQTHSGLLPDFQEWCCQLELKRGEKTLSIDLFNDFISKRVGAFCEAFGSNLLLYRYDYFMKDPLGVLNFIEDFLQVDRYFLPNNFENRVINSADRKENRRLAILFRNEKVVSLIGSLVPRKIVLALGRFRWRKASEGRGEKKLWNPPQNVLEQTKILLHPQKQALDQLFGRAEVIRGNGTVIH